MSSDNNHCQLCNQTDQQKKMTSCFFRRLLYSQRSALRQSASPQECLSVQRSAVCPSQVRLMSSICANKWQFHLHPHYRRTHFLKTVTTLTSDVKSYSSAAPTDEEKAKLLSEMVKKMSLMFLRGRGIVD